MSKKQLLTEGEIRRFMKYANLGPLSENFLSENIYEEEDMEGDMGAPVDDMGDMPPVDGVEGDMEGDMPAPQGNVEVEEDELAGLIERAVQKAVAAAMEAAGLGGGETAPEGDMDVMGDEAAPEGDDDEEEMEEGYGDSEHSPVMDEERMVSEVARRVMARLSESRKPQARPARAPARRSRAAAINEVTDRIMKRILKGK
jgi:hypothetical protein